VWSTAGAANSEKGIAGRATLPRMFALSSLQVFEKYRLTDIVGVEDYFKTDFSTPLVNLGEDDG
jgi:hypothetical protein